jgi:DNA-directed RNA polymerase subunit E"
MNANICPECKSTSVSEDWTGVVVIIDPEKSQIAKTLDIKKPGRYALRVR